MVDTGTAQMSEKVLAAIRKLSDKPIRYIVNTHFHPDHTGGNEAIGEGRQHDARAAPTEIVAHENVLNRMSAPTGKQAPTPTAAWPTDTFFPEEKDFFFNDEAGDALSRSPRRTPTATRSSSSVARMWWWRATSS